jgi:hypothetical protein
VVRTPAPIQRTRGRRSWLSFAAVGLVAAVVTGLVELGGEVGSGPVATDEREVNSAAFAPTLTQGSETPESPRGARRFAWAPVENADGYHVALFRGSNRVFAKRTTRPELTARVPAGEYRWYVWPVVDGRRATSAIVQTNLVIPAG